MSTATHYIYNVYDQTYRRTEERPHVFPKDKDPAETVWVKLYHDQGISEDVLRRTIQVAGDWAIARELQLSSRNEDIQSRGEDLRHIFDRAVAKAEREKGVVNLAAQAGDMEPYDEGERKISPYFEKLLTLLEERGAKHATEQELEKRSVSLKA